MELAWNVWPPNWVPYFDTTPHTREASARQYRSSRNLTVDLVPCCTVVGGNTAAENVRNVSRQLLHQSCQVTVIYSAIFNFWSGSLHITWERSVQSITVHTYTIITQRCVLLASRKADEECNCVERDTELSYWDGISGIVKASALYVAVHKLSWTSNGKTIIWPYFDRQKKAFKCISCPIF
jgi:hypothetical protein